MMKITVINIDNAASSCSIIFHNFSATAELLSFMNVVVDALSTETEMLSNFKSAG